MKVGNFDFFAFTYISMNFNALCSYVTHKYITPENTVNKLELGTYGFDDIFKYNNTSQRSFQEYNPNPQVAFFYTYKAHANNGCIFISNLQDGWNSFIYNIAKDNKVDCLSFQMDKITVHNDYAKNSMYFNNGKKEEERNVHAMIDSGRWIFYEEGPMLWFEDKKHYANRIIKKRFNYDIAKEYCTKNGINLDDDDFLYPKENSARYEHRWSMNPV